MGYGKTIQLRFGNAQVDNPFHILGFDFVYQYYGVNDNARQELLDNTFSAGGFNRGFDTGFRKDYEAPQTGAFNEGFADGFN
jgi:hypothetical protein